MSKEITKAIILQEIQDKLKLREYEPDIFSFSEQVVPVYNIEPHLTKMQVKSAISTITGTDGYTFFSVPEDEKWTLYGYNIIFMTGAFTIAGVMVAIPTASDYFYMDLTAAINVSYTHMLPVPIPLRPKDDINVNVDGYTSTGDLQLRILYTTEEIR